METKVCSGYLSRMTKIATTSIYGKIIWHAPGMVALGPCAIIVCSYNDPMLTLTFFTSVSLMPLNVERVSSDEALW